MFNPGPFPALAAFRQSCMMTAMPDWNFMTVIIVVALFLLWKLEFAATLLNLKAFPRVRSTTQLRTRKTKD